MGSKPGAVTSAIAATPGAREAILEMREKLKYFKIGRALAIEPKLYERIEKEIHKGDAKDVDALFRAAHAAEKIQQAVAGEGGRMDITHTNASPVSDLKVLIANLIERST